MNEDDYWENQRIKQDPQEANVYTHCDFCGGDIYKGEAYYNFEKYTICEECFDTEQEKEKASCLRIAGEDYDD